MHVPLTGSQKLDPQKSSARRMELVFRRYMDEHGTMGFDKVRAHLTTPKRRRGVCHKADTMRLATVLQTYSRGRSNVAATAIDGKPELHS